MKRAGLIAIGLLVGLVIGIPIGLVRQQGVDAKTAPVAQKTVTLPTVDELPKLVNAERAKNGVKPLKIDARLNASAQMKANDEVAYNYFGHVNHDGTRGYDYINNVGITCATDSENLRQNLGDNTSANTVSAWIASKPHHMAMINEKYTLTGFGINGDQIVEHFCQQ